MKPATRPTLPAPCAGLGVTARILRLAIGGLLLVGGPLIQAVPGLGIGLRLVLVLYLFLLAWRLWHAEAGTAGAAAIGFREVLLATLLNPKALIFAFVVFPPLGSVFDGLRYGGAFAGAVGLTGIGWLWLGATLGRMGARRAPRMLPRVSGVALGVIACVVMGSAVAAVL